MTRLTPAELAEYREHCNGMYGIAALLDHIAALAPAVELADATIAYDKAREQWEANKHLPHTREAMEKASDRMRAARVAYRGVG